MPNAIKKRRRQSDGNSKSDQVRALLAKGMSAGDIAKKVGCSTNLVYVVKSTGGAKGMRAAKRRAPNRQRIASKNLNGIDGILAVVQSAERERAQLRAALEKIQAVLADALA